MTSWVNFESVCHRKTLNYSGKLLAKYRYWKFKYKKINEAIRICEMPCHYVTGLVNRETWQMAVIFSSCQFARCDEAIRWEKYRYVQVIFTNVFKSLTRCLFKYPVMLIYFFLNEKFYSSTCVFTRSINCRY